MPLQHINSFFRRNLSTFEMTGVLMRIISFSFISWYGSESPFMFVWIVNTTDAVILTWCAVLKKDRAYTLLNAFWILVGLVGVFRAAGLL